MKLKDDSRVAVVGGGPAGAMAGFFLLELADRIGLSIHVDIYESRTFSKVGPVGCNMCAGVVSESLVQTLAAEGINLPPLVVQRGIQSYVLHTTDLDPVEIETPADDLRIATVYRGGGPRNPTGDLPWASFDNFLLTMAQKKGANVIHKRVSEIALKDGFPVVSCRRAEPETYDLLIGAVGVNSPTLRKFEDLGFDFKQPDWARGFISEIYLGSDQTQKYLGSAMHIFLLDIPGLKFAALIPKVEYVTVVLLGEDINRDIVDQFMSASEVISCFPPDFEWAFGGHVCTVEGAIPIGDACRCNPKLNMGPAEKPFTDRVVLIGDSAISRLYKDGIGAAYITAKSCAVASVFLGVSARDYEKYYWPVVNQIDRDNKVGKLIFFITNFYQKLRFLRYGMIHMVLNEEGLAAEKRAMSRVLWDTFTGSATYKEIFIRAIHPMFLWRLAVATFSALPGIVMKRFRPGKSTQ
ncbi:MAG: hypothetical protein HQL54_00480 [Magnetococcales bacterium]|nr:hypothetical protein [Magnetococcales bacterium]